MYNNRELDILSKLIDKEMKKQYFDLEMVNTELVYYDELIKIHGGKYIKNDVPLMVHKEIVLDKIKEIKDKLEPISSLYLKIKLQMEEATNKEMNEEQDDDWGLEM